MPGSCVGDYVVLTLQLQQELLVFPTGLQVAEDLLARLRTMEALQFYRLYYENDEGVSSSAF